MKKYYYIVLLLAIAIRPLYNVGVYTYYETNLNEIIEKYCINKDKPQLKCNGQCHLAKQLQSDTNVDIDMTSALEFAFFPVFFQEVNTYAFQCFLNTGHKKYFDYQNQYYFLSDTKIEHPPMV